MLNNQISQNLQSMRAIVNNLRQSRPKIFTISDQILLKKDPIGS